MQFHQSIIQAVVFLSLFAAGCATSAPDLRPAEMRAVYGKLAQGKYDDCIRQIDFMLEKRLDPRERVELLLQKGACLDGLGKTEESANIYREILSKYSNTPYSDSANIRLQRRDGDQKEQLKFDFGNEVWSIAEREWGADHLEVTYLFGPAQAPHAMLVTHSHDRTSNFGTLDKAMHRVSSELKMMETEMELLQRTESDAILMLHAKIPGHLGKFAILGRVLMGVDRAHMMIYSSFNARMLESERQKWIARLRSIKTVPAPQQALSTN